MPVVSIREFSVDVEIHLPALGYGDACRRRLGAILEFVVAENLFDGKMASISFEHLTHSIRCRVIVERNASTDWLSGMTDSVRSKVGAFAAGLE